jgi:hypothetical protein
VSLVGGDLGVPMSHSVVHIVGLSVSVQHYGGVWPRTAVALRCGGVCPSASFFGGRLRSWVLLLA